MEFFANPERRTIEDDMSGKINPVLREALKSARKRELDKKKKRLRKEEVVDGEEIRGEIPYVPEECKDDAPLGSRNRWSEKVLGKPTPGVMPSGEEGEFTSTMAKTAHEELLIFKSKILQKEKDGQIAAEGQHDPLQGKNEGDTGGDDAFDPEQDVELLESDDAMDPGSDDKLSDLETGCQDVELPNVDKCAPIRYPTPSRIPKESERLDTSFSTATTSRGDGQMLREVHQELSLEISKPLKRRVSMMTECRDVHRYEKLNRISEGTYGIVYRGRDLETNTICALKKLKMDKEKSGFPLTSVREINILLALEHPNIVNVSEVVMGDRHADPRDDQIFMVMEYADHDLSTVMQKRMKKPFTIAEVKCLMLQLLTGVAYLHENWVLHRDLKTANILYTNKGQLKICDFGLARQFSSFSRKYTQMVVTLWYRAPELLLGTREYTPAIDIWSVGCIMGELLTRKPLLPGRSEIEQLQKIYDLIGEPDNVIFSSFPLWDKMKMVRRSKNQKDLRSVLEDRTITEEYTAFGNSSVAEEGGIHLLGRLLDLNPQTRITARAALNHPWFSSHPLPKDPAMMPTFKATNDANHSLRKDSHQIP